MSGDLNFACPRCGRPVATKGELCATCFAELASQATVLSTGALEGDADAATVLAPNGRDSDEATRLGTPADADATVLAPASGGDADATVLAPSGGLKPADYGSNASGGDADATVLTPASSASDPDATVLTPAPAAGDADRTVLSNTPTPVGTGGKSRASQRATGPLTIGDTFGRYTIVRLLGIGGMGAVYQAWDKELEVVVALKVIRPEVLRDPVAEQEIERRFKRELLLARQVTHRNVVRIYDLGEIGGIKYITMSYVDGQELSALLKASGRLPIPDTLRIMRSVISGLAAAHAAGVIHRDLKPANIMIGKDGEALIMDFGIARSSGGPADVAVPADASGTAQPTGRYTQATVLGSVIGTVEYMAPEQARGEPIDHRADIYTIGLILYDMLVGKRRADHASSALDQLRSRMTGAVPPLKTAAPDVPDALAAVVTRAIEPEAAKRYQNTADLAAALDRLDDNGVPKPVRRVVSTRVAAAIMIVLLGIAGASWYFREKVPPPPPVAQSVVIADFENKSGDPQFDRTLEPTLRRALEGAGFITAYDRVGIRRTVGVAVPEKLDEAAARELAVKQGLNVVLTGAIEREGSRYRVSMKAIQAVEGKVVADVNARASTAADVIPTATQLVGDVREALGDQTTETDPIFAQRSISTTSLEVLRLYAAAQDASANNKWDDARQNLVKAIEVDPKFGLGYLLLSGVSRNMGNVQDANNYVAQAFKHVDTMTDRERLTTRGMYFRLTGDYKQCLQEQKDLIAAYKADVVGHNQLAVCASQLRDLDTARNEMRAIVDLLPKRVLFRDNLALYSNYAGDFAEGESQARQVLQLKADDAFGYLALGMSQLGSNKPADAVATFTETAKQPGLGPTFSASGLGDAAVYEGRYADAIRITEQGAKADIAAKAPDRAAAKLAHQGYANLLRGQKAAAVTSMERALALSKVVKIRFLAARTFIEAGQSAKAEPLVAALLAETQPEPRSYGLLLQSMSARLKNDGEGAIRAAKEAGAMLDTWIAHFELGRAYLAAKQYPQADSEFDRCLKRRGEAISLFLDEEPTYGYFPMVYFYQGLAREGMNVGGAPSFRALLGIREKAGEDPLIADLKRRSK